MLRAGGPSTHLGLWGQEASGEEEEEEQAEPPGAARCCRHKGGGGGGGEWEGVGKFRCVEQLGRLRVPPWGLPGGGGPPHVCASRKTKTREGVRRLWQWKEGGLKSCPVGLRRGERERGPLGRGINQGVGPPLWAGLLGGPTQSFELAVGSPLPRSGGLGVWGRGEGARHRGAELGEAGVRLGWWGPPKGGGWVPGKVDPDLGVTHGGQPGVE